MSEVFSFNGTTEQWRNFFDHATMNYEIKQILVDVINEGKDKKLFTSATPAGIKHTWATVRGLGFELVGSGEFVVNTPDLKNVLDIMKKGRKYTGTIQGKKLMLSDEEGQHRPTLKLASIEKHKNDGKSFVKPNVKTGKRHQISLTSTEEGLPIPTNPPKKGAKSKGWEQIVGFDAELLRQKLKDARTLGAKSMVLKTREGEDTNNGMVITLKSDKTNAPIEDTELIEFEYGEAKFDWEYRFATQHLQHAISLLRDTVYLGMTDQLYQKKNPGLWILTHVMNENGKVPTPEVTAGYLIGTMKEKKDG